MIADPLKNIERRVLHLCKDSYFIALFENSSVDCPTGCEKVKDTMHASLLFKVKEVSSFFDERNHRRWMLNLSEYCDTLNR